MAPRKYDSTAPSKSNRASKDSVAKQPMKKKKGYRKVRKLSNGLLDVVRTGGRYPKLYVHATTSLSQPLTMGRIRENGNTPLLRLPAEIRRMIWEYVFSGSVWRARGYPEGKKPLVKSLSILQTCRQIYSETCLLPYRVGTLSFSVYTLNWDIQGLRGIKLQSIRKMELEAGGGDILQWHTGSYWPYGTGFVSLEEVCLVGEVCQRTPHDSLRIALAEKLRRHEAFPSGAKVLIQGCADYLLL